MVLLRQLITYVDCCDSKYECPLTEKFHVFAIRTDKKKIEMQDFQFVP